MQEQLAGLSQGRKLALGGALLLFIAGFLPWWHASGHVGDFTVSVTRSGWHDLGPVVFILAILTIGWEIVRVIGVSPLHDKQADLTTAALGGAAAVFALIFFLIRLFGDFTGWGVWVGLVALIAVGYGAFLLFTSSGGIDAVKDLQGDLQAKAAEARASHGATPAEATSSEATSSEPEVADAEVVPEATDAPGGPQA
ncbi:MAG TPA: hypothetical protein VHB30_13930 [Solirubrobacteraceae bacterium]|nr:hypothetical protein [Solirubrobacteraceae bacterium]